jgi:hypothetical protein
MPELVGFADAATLTRHDTKQYVALHYNPASLLIVAKAKWQQDPSKGAKTAAAPEYLGSDPRTLTMTAWFDQVENRGRDVGRDVGTLMDWTRTTEQSHDKNTPQPPTLLLGWGVGKAFEGHLTSVSATYSLFAPDGTPLRASVELILTEVPTTVKRQNPTSGGPAGRRRATTVRGDSLPSLAQQEYGDPRLWRAIAAANGIDDPLRLAPGTDLLLPSAGDAEALAGRRRG